MTGLFASTAAQVRAEVTTRLRSASTLVALGVMLAASYLCIPDPHGKMSSLSWKTASGVWEAPVYDAAYLGFASAVLTGIFLLLAAFYLVAGGVRRDREAGLGPILASTPLTKAAYLFGKLAAGAAYLVTLSTMALPVGLLAFLRWGEGPFRPFAFLAPWLLMLPGAVFVAAMALLFDVTPGLRSRGGLVLWFFAGIFLMMALPVELSGGLDRSRPSTLPVFDPAGMATLERLAERVVPQAQKGGFSMGIGIHEYKVTRVPWRGITIETDVLAARSLAALWALPPFLLAVLLFDRFDPARGTLRLGRRKVPADSQAPSSDVSALAAPSATPSRPPIHVGDLAPVRVEPSLVASVLAEARLLWDTASWLKWPLAAASIAAAVLPRPASEGVAMAFLLLLVPVISEVAAREDLAGTRALVFSQPGVPLSAAVWKLAAVTLFLGAIAAPMLLRSLASPARFAALLTGLVFVAAFSVGAGSLTGGGKLFSGLFVALWYAAANGFAEADFCGVMGGALGAATRGAYLAVAATWIVAAIAVERRRARGT